MLYELAREWKPNFHEGEPMPAGTVIGEVKITVQGQPVTERMLADGIGLGLFIPMAGQGEPIAPAALPGDKPKGRAKKTEVVDE